MIAIHRTYSCSLFLPLTSDLALYFNRLRCRDLKNNRLSGTLPPELGNLSILQYFYATYNQLTGTVPPSYGRLPVYHLVRVRSLLYELHEHSRTSSTNIELSCLPSTGFPAPFHLNLATCLALRRCAFPSASVSSLCI